MTTIRNQPVHPLAELPSVLAMRDVRRRIRQRWPWGQSAQECTMQLLALDPLATFRALRIAHAPVHQHDEPVQTLEQLRHALGSLNLQRALETIVSDVAGTAPLRALWMHGLATALAAESLAHRSILFEPGHGYLLGLLADLPSWLELLSIRRHGQSDGRSWDRLIAAWRLPPWLLKLIDGLRTPERACSPSVELVRQARAAAHAAGFPHPLHPPDAADFAALDARWLERLELPAKLTGALAQFGLDGADVEPDICRVEPSEDLRLFPTRQKGPFVDLMLRLLDCGDGSRYRAITTVTTASGVRYLDFDRAFVLHWNASLGRVWIRAKTDLSPRGLVPFSVAPSAAEREALEHGATSRDAVLVTGDPNAERGLLATLGADEALLAPLYPGRSVSSFLVLDRSLSVQPIRRGAELETVRCLAGTARILIENQLVRRRLARAERFALTDPLTRLANRVVGISFLEQQIAVARRSGAPLSLIMVDVDEFKKLNDSRGHLVGDIALRRTADVLRRTMRRADLICRYGGEEFLIILPDTTIEDASVLATRLFVAVSETGIELDLGLTISVGLASLSATDDACESLLSRADRALYASKSRGRNRFSIDTDVPV
jgi:diguanylate cyclase (GGDEF)-like protein